MLTDIVNLTYRFHFAGRLEKKDMQVVLIFVCVFALLQGDFFHWTLNVYRQDIFRKSLKKALTLCSIADSY